MKTVKTLFILVSVVLIGIALGSCGPMDDMVMPPANGGGGDTTMPTVEPPTPVEPPADGGEDTTVPPVEPPTLVVPPPVEPPTPVVPPPVVAAGPVVSIMPAAVTSPAVGEQLVVEFQIAGAENVFGYEFTLMFDATALRYVESANGDYLSGAFFAPPMLKNDNQITITAGAGAASAAESGTLATVTFEVIARKASTLTLADVKLDHGGTTSEPQAVNAQISQ